jgi:predicted tellurium resistance membrane protein TerC
MLARAVWRRSLRFAQPSPDETGHTGSYEHFMRLIAILVVLFLATSVRAEKQPAKPTVRLELTDRTTVEGVWDAGSIAFKCDLGTLTLEPVKIKSLSFGEPNADILELDGVDHHFRGTANIDRLVVGGVEYIRDRVRSLKHIRARPPSIFSGIVIPLVTLTAMEIVLGIDNIIFLAIVAGKLPPHQQPKARRLGLIAALGTRLLLLGTLSFILGLTAPVFTLPDWPLLNTLEAREISWRDIILLAGGTFLIGKSTFEIHEKLEGSRGEERITQTGGAARFGMVLLQIAVIDIVFSLDSVVTAVGMVESLWVMVTAMLIAVGVMMIFAETIAHFVSRNPTIKILALAFLILIGVLLVADGLGQHIDKGYVYFAMAFSLVVEAVNIRMRKKIDPSIADRDELPSGIS